MAYVEDCSVAYLLGQTRQNGPFGGPSWWNTRGCLWKGSLSGKCKKIAIVEYGPNGQVLLSHPTPSLCTGTGLWRPKRGVSFICKRWCLHFRPSGGVEQGCKGGECSLITNHMLWILNGSPKPRRLTMLGSAELPLRWDGAAFWWESLQLSVSCIYGVWKDYLQIILRVFSQPYALFQW